MRRVQRAVLVGLAVALLASVSAPSAADPPAPLRTLVLSRNYIEGFAQDGRYIAWVTRARCGYRVHIRVLASGRTVTVGDTGCPSDPDRSVTGSLTLANGRALWSVADNLSSNVWSLIAMKTASIHDPRIRALPCCMWRHDWLARPDVLPRAGAGNVLVYYSHRDTLGDDGDSRTERAVRRVIGSKARRLFTVDRPYGLDVDRGRIAVVRRELRRGDGCGCAFAPTWSPDGGRIAFLRTYEPRYEDFQFPAEIAVMNADGTGVTSVTTDRRVRGALDWSSDGTKFVYAYEKDNLEPAIAVVNADGSGSREIAGGSQPTWSPRGSEIAFAGPGFRIAVVNQDGTGLRYLGAGTDPSWSPDGTQLAFVRNDALFVMRADGTGARRVVPSDRLPAQPTWSPDGRRIAYSDGAGIARVNANGTGRKLLTREEADGAPDWSPDGRRLVFQSRRDDLVSDETYETELYAIDAETGRRLRPLTFTRGDEWQALGEIRSARGVALRSFRSLGSPQAVVLSGSVAAVLTERVSGSRRIEFFDARSGGSRGVSRILGGPVESFSAGDNWIVFSGGRSIWGIDTRTRRKRLLARTRADPLGLSISGRRVAWAENTGGRGRIRAFLLPR